MWNFSPVRSIINVHGNFYQKKIINVWNYVPGNWPALSGALQYYYGIKEQYLKLWTLYYSHAFIVYFHCSIEFYCMHEIRNFHVSDHFEF